MSEGNKITEEEFSSVKALREQIIDVISATGQLKLMHDLMEDDLLAIKDRLNQQSKNYRQLLDKEKEVVDSLLKKYGMGSLDVETGVFTPENK